MLITTYAYNHQGQCIEITSIDGTQENDYDLMGNQTESKIFSPSGEPSFCNIYRIRSE